MSTLIPGSSSGVESKSKFPWRYACPDSLVFDIEFRKIFIARTPCGMRLSHSDAGNLRSVLAKPVKKYFTSSDGILISIDVVNVCRN